MAGIVPFLFMGLFSILNAFPRFAPATLLVYITGGLFLAGCVVMLIGFGVGWVRGFPRWSYAYVVCVPVFSLFMMALRISRQELLGWRALIPIGLVALIAFVLTRSLRPFFHLATGVWRDWTRLSFAIYSLMPLVVWTAFDEADNRFELPFMVVSTLVLTGGALAYMRTSETWQRALGLLAGTTLSGSSATIGMAIYWDGRVEPWMTGEPDRWYDVVRGGAIGGALLLALMFAPALLGLLRRGVESVRIG